MVPPLAPLVPVAGGLAWLAAPQSPDGSWEPAGFQNWCDGKPAKKGPDGQGKALYQPGVTGLAQVRGRDNLSIEERTTYDEEYVADRSVRLDVEILVATVGAVFRNPGEHSEA